jgi:hypothetical protein
MVNGSDRSDRFTKLILIIPSCFLNYIFFHILKLSFMKLIIRVKEVIQAQIRLRINKIIKTSGSGLRHDLNFLFLVSKNIYK